MRVIEEGTLLWQPSAAIKEAANLTRYLSWLKTERDLVFADYDALWRWSVDYPGPFWQSLWDYFEIKASAAATTALAADQMPGADWFPGARLNYVENLFRQMTADQPALLYQDESGPLHVITWHTLRQQTRQLALVLKGLGVGVGDRVVAYMPNVPETIVAFLATASLGAIWSSCSPDFGGRSVLDRFSQIEPKVLIAVDGYSWNGEPLDRRSVVAELQAALPGLTQTILVQSITEGIAANLRDTVLWADVLAEHPDPAPLAFAQVPFDHPLWVLYSSGTTGLPKPIVHGHGGILLEHLKAATFHLDLKRDDRFFWYTSTGWMMWNYLVGGLQTGCTIILYNGSPAYPDLNRLWNLAEETGMTYFGTSAAFIHACLKADLTPSETFDLRRIRGVGSTGSPLSPAGFGWVYDRVAETLALESLSGGTDLCTAFVGGCRLKPIYAGEIQGACLGAAVFAYNEAGESVTDEVGELVITRPMPSMPLYFWRDPGNERYRESYFGTYAGIWRHGDWIKINERGGCVIYGRSDSTINRQGVRMGTSEIYAVVEAIDEIEDSLVIDLELLGRESYLPLFVVMRSGAELDEALHARIREVIRREVSPRHVPNDIFAIAEIPYTLSGKKMEVPIRKILLGHDVSRAVNLGAMRNPSAIQYFIAMAERLGDAREGD